MAPHLESPRHGCGIKENTMNTSHASTGYELRFQSLFGGRRGYAFPCDAEGHVDMDPLSEPVFNNYLYARAMMGLELDVRPSRPN
jgi:hypothetical protein